MSTEPDVPSLPQASLQRIALRRIWALLRPYWYSEDRWPGRGLLALVLSTGAHKYDDVLFQCQYP